ncbi:nuclear transport factor 2 family protein [Actinomadura sp. 9N407]|uniref:nuclear transport factor 2 family protein n=1 Tax=Actinomadura sp. 9N407 TaxID=3375154 RepID=UPI0037A66E4D
MTTGRDAAREEIVHGLCAAATALDTRDWDALGAAFTPDATGYGASGRDAIVAQVRRHLGGCGPSQHLLGNHRVEVDGDQARSLTYGRVMHLGKGPTEGLTYECFGEYEDHWTRTGEGWLITSRTFRVTIELGDRSVLRPA